MNIQQLLQNNPDGLAIISLADLREFANELLEAFKPSKEEETSKEDVYYTAEQTSQLLNVDKSTLWRWQKCGYLLPVKIGRRNYYSKLDVEAILKKAKSA